MKTIYRANLLMIATIVLVINIAGGQQLATKWTTNIAGSHMPTRHMAVVPETGHRYLITTQGDDQFNLVHLDQDGREIWNIPERGGFHPQKLVYNRGKIFLFGIVHLAGSSTIPVRVRMYEDLGSAPNIVWDHDIPTEKGNNVTPQLMIADSRGTGVTITSIYRTYDGSQSNLKTLRISAYREIVEFDDVNLGYSETGVWPSINAMCDDYVGNVFITGTSRYNRRSTDPDYVTRTSAFVVRFGYDGGRAWSDRIAEDEFNYIGFDIAVEGSDVYMLGQRVRQHPVPGQNPLLMVWRLDHYDGDIERAIPLPSRSWDPLSRERKALFADRAGVVVAYNSIDTSIVTVKGFNSDLVRQWSQDITVTSGAHVASIMSPSAGRLVVGVNDRITSGSRMVLTTLTREGTYVDRFESIYGTVVQMEADASGQLHIGGYRREPEETIETFQQLLEYRPNYRAFPSDLYATPWVLVELQSQGRLQHWGSFSGTWNCTSIPCNATFVATLAGSNASWKEIMTKPTTISLPQDNKFKTFSFSLQGQVPSKLLFEVDRTLIDNGIKSLKIETDWNAATMTVTSTTDGPSIPLTLTLIGTSGKVIGELKTTAPAKQVFKDRVAEPVSFIRITAPPVAPTVSIFPNPSNGKFKVTLDQDAGYPLQLAIHDGQGNKVHQQAINSSDTDVALNNPLPGFYVLRLTADKLNITKQLQIK